jgi:hypothetical protein
MRLWGIFKKSLTFLVFCAIFYIVPLFEEALYLRTSTGELLNSGSPGFFLFKMVAPSRQKRLTFLVFCAIFYIVPHLEEALYLREPTGELLQSGSPGFFMAS